MDRLTGEMDEAIREVEAYLDESRLGQIVTVQVVHLNGPDFPLGRFTR